MLCGQRPAWQQSLQEVPTVGTAVVGVPGGGQVKGLGGLGASEQEVAGAEASIMGVVCSRCVAPWHGQGEVAVPTVSTALGSSAEL